MHSLLPDTLTRMRFNPQQAATLREYRGKQRLHAAQAPEMINKVLPITSNPQLDVLFDSLPV
jgi:hypothetical protein